MKRYPYHRADATYDYTVNQYHVRETARKKRRDQENKALAARLGLALVMVLAGFFVGAYSVSAYSMTIALGALAIVVVISIVLLLYILLGRRF